MATPTPPSTASASTQTTAPTAQPATASTASTTGSSSSGNAFKGSSAAKPAASTLEGNPAFNMLGVPKSVRTFRLPSRNWLIFWGLVGSFGGAVGYDRWEKRRIVRRYCSLVSHLAEEPLQPMQMPRKLTVYLAAPPGDTIHASRDHFHEYVKPVLNAAACDFELVEGRMQGDTRHKVAQAIRDRRRGVDGLSDTQRQSRDKLEFDKDGGDLVVGRHTYKEYIRGLHEGYLGPAEEPDWIHPIMHPRMPGDPVTEAPAGVTEADASPLGGGGGVTNDAQTEEAADAVPAATTPAPAVEKSEEEIQKEIEEIKKTIPSSPPSYISPSAYAGVSELSLPPQGAMAPFGFVTQPHLLGFLNTPWRVARFLNRRALAESVCQATAGAVLATAVRDFDPLADVATDAWAECDWPKKNRQRTEGPWMEPIAIDDRVAKVLKVYAPVVAPEVVAEKEKHPLEIEAEQEAAALKIRQKAEEEANKA